MIRRSHGYLLHRDTAPNAAAQELEREGFTLVESVFTPQQVQALIDEVTEVFDTEPGDQRGPNPDAWDMFRYAMLNRSAACHAAVANRGILDVIEPLLGEDCHVIANTAWRNPPAKDGLHRGERWHIDAGPHVPLPAGTRWPDDIPHPVFAVGVHIFLQACGLADGPTGVLPRSHLSGGIPPRDRLLDDDLQFNGRSAVPLLAAAGDVCFFVSDVWHRRLTTLPGDSGRFFLQVHYGRRDIAQRLQPTAEVNHLSAQALSRLATERDKTLAGLHPRFFYDG